MGDHKLEIIDKDDLNKRLTCSMCKRYLNVPPIMFHSELGSICGRCTNLVPSEELRQTRERLTEALLKTQQFPCHNFQSGCKEILKFDVRQHESKCGIMHVQCPLEKCLQIKPQKDIEKHITQHVGFFRKCIRFLYNHKLSNRLNFIFVNSHLMAVSLRQVEKKRYRLLVTTFSSEVPPYQYTYQVKLYNKSKARRIIIGKKQVASMPIYPDGLDYSKSILLDFDRYSPVFKHKKIYLEVNITLKHNKNVILFNPRSKKTAAFLREFECPVCRYYMVPPIFNCQEGHSVCWDCQVRTNYCPICRIIGNCQRSFALERIMSKISFPCANRKKGCPFTSTAQEVRKHEDVCPVNRHPCILKCNRIVNFVDYPDHIRQTHPSEYFENGREVVKLFNTKQFQHVIHVNRHFFLLTMQYYMGYGEEDDHHEPHFRICLEHAWFKDMVPFFSGLIRISNASAHPGRTLTIKNVVQKWSDSTVPFIEKAILVPCRFMHDNSPNSFYFLKVEITNM